MQQAPVRRLGTTKGTEAAVWHHKGAKSKKKLLEHCFALQPIFHQILLLVILLSPQGYSMSESSPQRGITQFLAR